MALRGSVARRYARALFRIGVDRASYEAQGAEIESLASAFAGSAELRQALESPMFKLSEKRAILDKLLPRVAPGPFTRSFALLLLDRGRIGILPAVARAYRELADEHAGRVRAVVTSARPLDPAALAGIQRTLERRTGKKVLVEAAVDPDLIGGVVARVGGLVLDGSVRAKLDAMKEKLLN